MDESFLKHDEDSEAEGDAVEGEVDEIVMSDVAQK